jgi:hypothetical protein
METELQRLERAFLEADRRAQQGDETAKQDAALFAQEIRRLQAQTQDPEYMSRINRGIAGGLGAPVDIVAGLLSPLGVPRDALGGSESIARGMEAIGIPVAQDAPQGLWENLAQGAGEGAGFLLPMGAVAKGVQSAGGVAAGVGRTLMEPFLRAPVRATAAEMAGGAGALAGANLAVENAPAGFEPYAGLLGAIAGGAAGAATPDLHPVTVIGRAGARWVGRTIFPFTEAGGKIRARERVQSLAANPQEQAEALAEAPISGVSPAAQTGDPNLIALERAILSRNPALRDEFERRQREASRTLTEAARSPAEGFEMSDTRRFIEARRGDFIAGLKDRVDQARRQATEAIQALTPERTPEENSTIVRQELQRAYDEGASLENDLWRAIDENVMVGTSTARRTFADIDKQTSRATEKTIYPDARRFLGAQGEFSEAESVREMRGLYSALRRDAREAIAGPVPDETRARNSNLLAEAIWEDLTDVVGPVQPKIVAQLQEAREYSRVFNDTFNRGSVGQILSQTRTGAERVAPEMTLGTSVGTGQTSGAVASRQIREAVDFPQLRAEGRRTGVETTTRAVEDFLREGLRRSAAPGGADLRLGPATEFQARNQTILAQYPVLSRQLDEALRRMRESENMAQRTQGRVAALSDPRRSAGAALEASRYGAEIERSIFGAQNPVQAAREIARQAARDTTGAASRGLKGGFVDYVISQARTGAADIEGGPVISGNRFVGFLRDRKNLGVALSILDRGEYDRLQQIGREFQAIEAARSGRELTAPMEDLPSRAISFIAGTLAARAGAQLGQGTSGASLRTANLAVKTLNAVLGRLTNDKAEALLRDAIQDRDLFRALLMPINSPSQARNLERQLSAWQAGAIVGTTATLATRDEEPR